MIQIPEEKIHEILEKEHAMYSGAGAAQLFIENTPDLQNTLKGINPALEKLPRGILVKFLNFSNWPLESSRPFIKALLRREGLPELSSKEIGSLSNRLLEPFKRFFAGINGKITKEVSPSKKSVYTDSEGRRVFKIDIGGKSLFAASLRGLPKENKPSDLILGSDLEKVKDALECTSKNIGSWSAERQKALNEYIQNVLEHKALKGSVVRILGNGSFFKSSLRKISDVDASVFLSNESLRNRGMNLEGARRVLLSISQELYEKYGFFVGAPYHAIRRFEDVKREVSSIRKNQIAEPNLMQWLVCGVVGGHDLGGHKEHEQRFRSYIWGVEKNIAESGNKVDIITGRIKPNKGPKPTGRV